MTKDATTFHTIVGTKITAKVLRDYADMFLPMLNLNSKPERAYKRKLDRLILAIDDVSKFTDFLVNHPKIAELSELEADSIETVLFMASDLDIEKRAKVIEFIEGLNNKK